MAVIKNFDELKRMHNLARISKAGSRDWIEFAVTMLDSFPAIYEIAKNTNAEMAQLRRAKFVEEPHF